MGLLRRKKGGGTSNSGMIGYTLFMLTTEGVIVVEPDMNIQLINPAAEAFLEVTTAEAKGLNYMSMVRLEDVQGGVVDVIAQAQTQEKPTARRDLIVIGRQSGRRVSVELTVVKWDGGFILNLRDITVELKREAAEREFISTASHEMRTPVASIRGFVELALNPQTATIDDRARNYLTKAQTASLHLGGLFRDLLDTTKADDKQERIQLYPVDFAAEVKRISDLHAPSIAEKGLNYQFGTTGAAGGKFLAPALYAQVNVQFLVEVLDNLIENAIKYTQAGWVTVTVGGDERYVWAVVSDTGTGISPEDSKHVFQKFYRVDSSFTRTVGGTGLGLYLVKERAEQMGGNVQLKSEVGKGSQFSLILPRLSSYDYERIMQAQQNAQAMTQKTLHPTEGSVQ